MPRRAATLASLLALPLIAGAAETAPKPPAAAPTPPAAMRQAISLQPPFTIVSLQTETHLSEFEIVAKVSNISAVAIPGGSWGIELACVSPSFPQHIVRRALEPVPAHGQVEVWIFGSSQHVSGLVPTHTIGPDLGTFGVSVPSGNAGGHSQSRQTAPLMDPSPKPLLVRGPAWTCKAGLGLASGAGGFPTTIQTSLKNEFDFGISGIVFEPAATAPPTVNVRVSVLSKKVQGENWAPPVASIPRTLHVDCRKAGQTSRVADLPAAETVLFGSSAAGFLQAPATGWSCRTTLVGPGADADPTNDSWSLAAP
jgi:hypothetical protein